MPLWNDKQDPIRSTGETGALPEISRRPPPMPGETTAPVGPDRSDELPAAPAGSSDLLLGAGAVFEGKLTF